MCKYYHFAIRFVNHTCSRLDTRQTGAKIDTFLKDGKIIHVDIDENELKYHRIHNQVNLNMSVYSFLENLDESSFNLKPAEKWLDYVLNIKQSIIRKLKSIDL